MQRQLAYDALVVFVPVREFAQKGNHIRNLVLFVYILTRQQLLERISQIIQKLLLLLDAIEEHQLLPRLALESEFPLGLQLLGFLLVPSTYFFFRPVGEYREQQFFDIALVLVLYFGGMKSDLLGGVEEQGEGGRFDGL